MESWAKRMQPTLRLSDAFIPPNPGAEDPSFLCTPYPLALMSESKQGLTSPKLSLSAMLHTWLTKIMMSSQKTSAKLNPLCCASIPKVRAKSKGCLHQSPTMPLNPCLHQSQAAHPLTLVPSLGATTKLTVTCRMLWLLLVVGPIPSSFL
jgi:hypothetical protein